MALFLSEKTAFDKIIYSRAIVNCRFCQSRLMLMNSVHLMKGVTKFYWQLIKMKSKHKFSQSKVTNVF